MPMGTDDEQRNNDHLDELHREVERIECRLRAHREKLADLAGRDVDSPRQSAAGPCPHRKRLQRVIVETVEVLEKTKKSFKSKQLKRLREKLMRELKQIA